MIELERDRPLAVDLDRDMRVRVVDGTIWVTTSGSLDDVWLHAGDEHRFPSKGLTVLEAVDRRSTVAVTPSLGRDQTTARRTVFGVTAAAMTLLTTVLLVILPAQMAPHAAEPCAPVASADVESPIQ